MLLTQLLIATAMILLTVIMHASLYEILFRGLQTTAKRLHGIFGGFWKPIGLGGAVLVIFGMHVLTIWMWAHLMLYLDVKPLDTLEDALYYTTTSYTTVGFGDLVVEERWRLLGSCISADGLMLFGWTIAFLYEIMNKIHSRDQIKP